MKMENMENKIEIVKDDTDFARIYLYSDKIFKLFGHLVTLPHSV